MAFIGDDDWDFNRRQRPSARHANFSDFRGQQHLTPDDLPFGNRGAGLHRTRSQGHSPHPVVNIYNDNGNESNMRHDSTSPPTVHIPYPMAPEVQRPSSRGRAHSRSHSRLGDELNDLRDDFADLALETRRLRSRSRGRSDVSPVGRSDFYECELRQKEKQLREIKLAKQMARDEDRVKTEMELERAKEEAKRKADEVARKDERKRIIDEHLRKEREDADAAKAEEKRIAEKLEKDKREKKEREEKEYKEFLRIQKEKKDAEAAKAKADKEALDAAMRARFAEKGFTPQQIDALLADKTASTAASKSPSRAPMPPPVPSLALQPPALHRPPTYAKVHRDFLSVDTLVYFGLPYEYDRTDPSYLIILREMDRFETEALFDHTRRLRDRSTVGAGGSRLLLEAPKEKAKYAWYRKRDRSEGGERVRRSGILEVRR